MKQTNKNAHLKWEFSHHLNPQSSSVMNEIDNDVKKSANFKKWRSPLQRWDSKIVQSGKII